MRIRMRQNLSERLLAKLLEVGIVGVTPRGTGEQIRCLARRELPVLDNWSACTTHQRTSEAGGREAARLSLESLILAQDERWRRA